MTRERSARWQVAEGDSATAASLAQQLGVPGPVAHVYLSRGLDTPQKLRDYADMGMHKLHSPCLLPDIDAATARLEHAIRTREHIKVVGDYDVDGITATAVAVLGLQRLGGLVSWQLPNRITDGYGLHPATVERCAADGADVILAVDCGTTAHDASAVARLQGVDIIIADHHMPAASGVLPECTAIVNPQRADSAYPFRGLASVGLVMKLMQAVGEKFGVSGSESVDSVVDLVALGTVADMSPMVDENRSLVTLGCQRLSASMRPGVQQLLRLAQVHRVTPVTIGYALGPHINAVGRLSDPTDALRLLLESDFGWAGEYANRLDEANGARQYQQQQAVTEAVSMLPPDMSAHPVIVVWSRDWHAGIIGLVAGELAKRLHRPAVVCAVGDDGTTKGSCRSFASFNILKALDSEPVWELFSHYGGHEYAAGFTIGSDLLPLLAEQLTAYAAGVIDANGLAPVVAIDAELPAADITTNTYESLLCLAPFGEQNRTPTFLTRGLRVAHASRMGPGGRHLKLRFRVDHATGAPVDAILWRQGERIAECPVGASVDAAYSLTMDEYRGKANLVLTLEDLRRAE